MFLLILHFSIIKMSMLEFTFAFTLLADAFIQSANAFAVCVNENITFY